MMYAMINGVFADVERAFQKDGKIVIDSGYGWEEVKELYLVPSGRRRIKVEVDDLEELPRLELRDAPEH